jgi:hypothetical protein
MSKQQKKTVTNSKHVLVPRKERLVASQTRHEPATKLVKKKSHAYAERMKNSKNETWDTNGVSYKCSTGQA